jgi:hypothetical protein
MKIDFIIPWVDGNDPEWIKKKIKHDKKNIKDYTNSDMRYRDWGLLKYVFRGIEKNCPWYNKIILITEGHYPKWLQLNHPNLLFVTHEELFFDTSHLPTFNSNAIEMNLPNIVDKISDKFIYMNDDLLILKPVNQNRFFSSNGLPVDFFSHGWLPRNKLFKKLRGMNAWAHSIKNNIDLINKYFKGNFKIKKEQLYHPTYDLKTFVSNFLFENIYKKVIWIKHYHQPQPYLKETLIEVYKNFKDEMMKTSKHKFRCNEDLNPYLYRYWQLLNGKFYPYMHKDHKYYKIQNKKDMKNCVKEMDKYTFVCPNDSVSDNVSNEELEYIIHILKNKLEKILPEKSSFEK